MKPYRIEILNKQDRKSFDCGVEVLNNFLETRAGQEQRKHFSVCYLLIENASDAIAGFYTLSSCSFPLTDLPESIRQKIPRYEHAPASRVGRLAVDRRFQGQSLGSVLLADAVKRSANSGMGVYAMVVDAKDRDAVSFYRHFGFECFDHYADVLYLPISVALKNVVN